VAEDCAAEGVVCRTSAAAGSMTERVEDGGLVRLDLMASALKLGRGAMARRSF